VKDLAEQEGGGMLILYNYRAGIVIQPVKAFMPDIGSWLQMLGNFSGAFPATPPSFGMVAVELVADGMPA